jgi:hypothetical protein
MRKILLFFLFLLPISFAQDFSVGVSPLIIDLGTIEKGGTEAIEFNVITGSTEPFFIYMIPENGLLDFFNKAGYEQLIYNYSEQETKTWITLLDNPVRADPVNQSDGKSKTKRVNILLNVPRDAENGYHIVNIKPSPEIPTGATGGGGTTVIGVVSVNILFKLQGDAVRAGKILDVVQIPYSKGVAFKTYFKNTGTMTISARVFQDIYDGSKIAESQSFEEKLAPGDTKDFTVSFQLEETLPDKEYTIHTTVDYTTEDVSMNSTMKLEAVYYPTGVEEISIPLWLLALLIIIIFVVIYRWVK